MNEDYREIPLTRGFVALVDSEDYERMSAHKWFAHGKIGHVYAAPSGPQRPSTNPR